MFRAQPGGATFAVSIAKHAARHCARTKKHCSTPNYTGVVLTLHFPFPSVSSPAKYLALLVLLSFMGDSEDTTPCTFAHLDSCSIALTRSNSSYKCFLHPTISHTLCQIAKSTSTGRETTVSHLHPPIRYSSCDSHYVYYG